MDEQAITDLTTLNEAGDWLERGMMARICAAVRFPAEVTGALSEAAERIGSDAESAGAARRFRHALFLERGQAPETANRELLAFGADGAALAAVVYAGAIPLLGASYRRLGLPAGVLVDTVQDVALWMEVHRKRHGRWGLSELDWLHQHLSGELFRLGRLQFHYIANPLEAKAFRHGKTGEVAVLSEAGIRYRADGQLDGTCGVHDPEGAWESAYSFDGRHHEGHPISEAGAAGRLPIRLDADEWELALEKGDPVLNVHVPEGDRLSPEACRDSYANALRFTAAHYPDKPFRAFVCQSWLLAPQFRELLPASSNIVRFQRDYRLLPNSSDESQTLERVFGYGTRLAVVPAAQAHTSLQRIVRDHLAGGGRIHNGGGFRLV
ncbi:acyltransferase domain-containing protein [Paenibacillus glycinis]|uniref:DUF5596 domain-containing protein n=1 Tax=Paenibacillus glycinis TaxID=2697035 RepID=A0ABW9XRQ5_9BACL|nr:acyltransferase domain-containing protein [Paenibacillus glycinis]NBD25328.1 hypothetical protein [Paenibacillus glycinis]